VVPAPDTVRFLDACAAPGHTNHMDGADDAFERVPLPFAFRYWATNLTAGALVNITSNGWIGLDGMPNAALGGSIPTASAPNAVIALHWTDNMNRNPMCVATFGTAPNRQWVVEWDAHHYCCSDEPGVSLTYEVILSETSNFIDFVYQTIAGARGGTAGLENPAGTAAVGACPGGATACTPTTGTRVRFQPTP
jgi:hypothetical protein